MKATNIETERGEGSVIISKVKESSVKSFTFLIEASHFSDNVAMNGGALVLVNQKGEIKDTLFKQNRAIQSGGAASFECTNGYLLDCITTIRNSNFTRNQAT